MAKVSVLLGSCFVIILFAVIRFSRQLDMKASYHLVEKFYDLEEKFDERHNIVRRAAGQSNTSTVDPIKPSRSISQSSITQQATSIPKINSVSSWNASTASPSPSASSTRVLLPTSSPSSKVYTTNSPDHTDTTIKTGGPTTDTTIKSGGPTTGQHSGSTTESPRTTKSKEVNKTIEDHHKYYRSLYYSKGEQWWFNLDDEKAPKFHKELSKNTIFSDSLKTTFKFPYYGHLIDNVTITNRGYVFLGERFHKFHASAQYVAPLMANFGPDLHENTAIRYVDTGNRFTVEWANMRLIEEPANEFTFQCSILKNGTLVFAYKTIPIPVEKLKSAVNSFVRVGLSDSFRLEERRHAPPPIIINGRSYASVHIIYYYLYDRVELKKSNVIDGSAFVIIPVPNCVTFNSCISCVETETKFSCAWCPKLKRCSDGVDRHREAWLSAGCLKDSVTKCSSKNDSGIGAGEIVLIVLILTIVLLLICLFVYAYRHPQSKSGMFLIQYGNPLKWCRNSSTSETQSGTQSGRSGGRISFKTMSFENNA